MEAKKKIFSFKKTALMIVGLLVVAGFAFSYRVILGSDSTINNIIQKENKTPLYKQVGYLLQNDEKKLSGEEKEDRINIVLMGMGGEGHAGGIYLADTIMIASFQPSTKKVALISIPRDMVVDIKLADGTDLGYRKINNANAYGIQYDYPGGGEKLTAEVLEKVTGLHMDYFLRVDFEGFRKIIDDLGGVTVDVERSFVDYQYPDYNFGYQTVKFEKGKQELNGEKALQFARSRKGVTTGTSDGVSEGSDFARSKRQQKIIFAAKQKFFSLGTLLNPVKINSILNDLGEHVSTNMEIWEMIRFADLAQEVESGSVVNKVLDNSAGGLLHSEISSETGAYVLIPNAGLGKYAEIQAMAKNIFLEEKEASREHEAATLAIENGTKETGLAKTIATELETLNFTIVRTENAITQTGNEKTVIYDFTDNSKPQALRLLKEQLAANIATGIPVNIRNEQKQSEDKVDFLVIIGNDNTSALRAAREKAKEDAEAAEAAAEAQKAEQDAAAKNAAPTEATTQ